MFPKSVLLNGGQDAAMVECCGGFFDNRHMDFVKGCLPFGAISRNSMFDMATDFWHSTINNNVSKVTFLLVISLPK
jgi:hypothetical protein